MPRRPLSSRSRKVAATLGEYLVTFRKLQGLTAEQVADRAGITRTTFRRLEHGDPSVGLDVFLEVCRALGILDFVLMGMNPYETAMGQALAQSMHEQKRTLPERVRRSAP